MKFQDELESGKRERTDLISIPEQVEQYRQKLLERVGYDIDVEWIYLCLLSLPYFFC